MGGSSSREVRRKVVNISTPSYSFAKIHKTDILKVRTVTDNQGRQFKVGDYPIPGGREELMDADRNGLIPFDENEHRGMGHQVFRSGNTGKWYCMTHNVEFDASALLERRKAASSDIESQELREGETDPLWGDKEKKMIPPNEALEEKGKTQEASWGTAIENEDEVAGDDVKIERQKAQKEKEQKLGVGHLSEDKPTTHKIKKQLENLKKIIKQPESILKAYDADFLQGSDEAGKAIRGSEQARKQGNDSGE